MEKIKNEEISIEDRRKKIIELLNQKGKVKVVDLSSMFNISEVTIRNDLTELDSLGNLERVHGGAVTTNKAYYNMSLHDRMKTHEEEKRAIAKAAASLVSEGDTIMINSGTTTLFTVQEIKSVKNLTIVTNSIPIAQEAGYCNNIHVILLGGNFNPQYQFTYGDDTLSQLKRYKADKFILAADGVSSEEGVTTYHHLEAEVNRVMMARSNATILVSDYTKIGRASFVWLDAIDNIDVIVTNSTANQEEIKAIRGNGIDVKLV